ncbi:MAG TPA: hypothetical protein VI958_00555 [Acidobacteriota bacterium]
MFRYLKILWLLCGLFLYLGCGQEYYSTPEKTLARYVENRSMRTPAEIEKCLNCFKKSDKKWWQNNYVAICQKKFGTFHALCAGTKISESNIWSAIMEEAGPTEGSVESVDVDEDEKSAVVVADGMEVYFVKESSNWKIDGFFGVDEELKDEYPDLQ